MKNITIKEYAILQDRSIRGSDHDAEQYAPLEHMKPCTELNGYVMDVNAMPYANVKYCLRLLNFIDGWDKLQELFHICFDVSEEAFWNMPVSKYFAARNHIIAQFKMIVERENKAFASKGTDDHFWNMAGADNLKPFADTLPLINLGKMLGQYPFDLGRRPYSEVFNLLMQTKAQGEVERKYHELITKK